jgi:virulence factor Mce-like protein
VRRLLAIPLAAVLVVAVLSAAGGETSGYRVDAIFDRTAALIPGQEVRVAGAKVGNVTDIVLTPDRRARVQMEVGEGFAPFHRDSECVIRQDALLGEKFVECDPGSPESPELNGRDGEVPTVPLERNTTPVEIDTVLSTLRLPYRERLAILLNEFGYGLAGRGDDLDETIRRANPALREANDLLRELGRDRERIGRLVEGTDAAVAELARRRREVQGLVERGAEVAQATASRRGDLQEAIRRLPPLLDEIEPSARRLASFARQATPSVRQLRAAAPSLRQLLGDFDPLSDAAVPALERLARASRTGRRTVKVALPVARLLRRASRELPSPVATATELVESLRDQGALEGTLRFFYYGTAASARYDAISHMLPSFQVVSGTCGVYVETPTPGCSARFAAPEAIQAGAGRRRRSDARELSQGRSRGLERQPASPGSPAPSPQTPSTPAPPSQGGGGGAGQNPLDELLRNLGLPLDGQSPQREGPTGIPLLDYLLGP